MLLDQIYFYKTTSWNKKNIFKYLLISVWKNNYTTSKRQHSTKMIGLGPASILSHDSPSNFSSDFDSSEDSMDSNIWGKMWEEI